MARVESRVEVPSAISGRAINDWAVRTEHLLAKWRAYRGNRLILCVSYLLKC